MNHHQHREVPRLQEPLQQLSQLPPKNPYYEEDKPVIPHEDTRPKMVKDVPGILVPRFNTLYDSAGSTQGWRYMADAFVHGSIATSVNSTVTTPVQLANSPNWKLQQWPGAVQLFLVVRFFGIVPGTVPTANAGMECLFIDNFGNTIPLGEVLSQTGGNLGQDVILPTALTDPGNPTLGTLSVTLANVASANSTYLWSMGFSAGYMLPSRYGYEVLEEHEYYQIENKFHKKEKHHGHS